MTTIRQMFISRAVLIIMDSGCADLSDKSIGEALDGAAELNCDYRRYNSQEMTPRAERLLLNDVRRGVEKRLYYKNSGRKDTNDGRSDSARHQGQVEALHQGPG